MTAVKCKPYAQATIIHAIVQTISLMSGIWRYPVQELFPASSIHTGDPFSSQTVMVHILPMAILIQICSADISRQWSGFSVEMTTQVILMMSSKSTRVLGMTMPAQKLTWRVTFKEVHTRTGISCDTPGPTLRSTHTNTHLPPMEKTVRTYLSSLVP